jgi:hypothetical protein
MSYTDVHRSVVNNRLEIMFTYIADSKKVKVKVKVKVPVLN